MFAPCQFLLQPHHIAATSVLISLIPSQFAVQYPQAATTIQRPTASISVHLFCLSLRLRTAPTKFLFTNSLSIAVYHSAIDLYVQQSNLSKLITTRLGCGLDHTVCALDASPKLSDQFLSTTPTVMSTAVRFSCLKCLKLRVVGIRAVLAFHFLSPTLILTLITTLERSQQSLVGGTQRTHQL